MALRHAVEAMMYGAVGTSAEVEYAANGIPSIASPNADQIGNAITRLPNSINTSRRMNYETAYRPNFTQHSLSAILTLSSAIKL
jgi:hypothetical protein